MPFWHGYSPVNLLHIFRTPFLKNTSGGVILHVVNISEKTCISYPWYAHSRGEKSLFLRKFCAGSKNKLRKQSTRKM